MEILQSLLSYVLQDLGGENLKPLLDSLKKNDFNVKKVISELKPETILPLLSEFFNLKNKNQNPEPSFTENSGLVPLSNFADAQIVARLNEYFTAD